VRDSVRLRASVLASVAVEPAADAKPKIKRRPRIVHTATFDERMASEAQRLEDAAKKMAPGKDREVLLRKARQTRTAAHINGWLSSPGLLSPK
jgi:uncharacterized ferredoxin-like protein